MEELTKSLDIVSDDHIDDHVDDEIQRCLMSEPPKSFFMFAGAGSGKTRSLINTLEFLAKEKGEYLLEHGKQVAVITYTNAACDEINRRLQYSPIFMVSTIHSFLWELIKNFQVDIRQWLEKTISKEISELQSKVRKTANEDKKFAKKKERLERIKLVKRFTYNPNGDNVGFDSLEHSEVVSIGAKFISSEETMKQILVDKYPILLIDESQDTKRELVEALLEVYKEKKGHWTIGMFGDSMQRIYQDGKENLEAVIPSEWERPGKVMNHRSAKRIVSLANAIRLPYDHKEQNPRSDSIEGSVRLFIAHSDSDKDDTERKVAKAMAEVCNDEKWLDEDGFECLILEHLMAAKRFHFDNIYSVLNESKLFDTALRKGEIPEISFLYNTVLPLIKAHQNDDEFEVTRLLRRDSPLLSREIFKSNLSTQQDMIQKAELAAESLFSLWNNGLIPSCIEVLKNIHNTGLYILPKRTTDILNEDYIDVDPKVDVLRKALSAQFDEMERYAMYVSDESRFATHQGVKGLEYPRVMVILDDAETRGKLFSYEKLFGVKELSDTDLKNAKDGKDNSVDRTARLFYVACTRAMESLAVVAYSVDPVRVKTTALKNSWFLEEEIQML